MVRATSDHVPDATHRNVTVKNRALTVPVASVPVFRKPVPHVSTNDVVPEVVIANVTRSPIFPPAPALNVQAPVGVIVFTAASIGTDCVPVVAGVAFAPIRGSVGNPVWLL